MSDAPLVIIRPFAVIVIGLVLALSPLRRLRPCWVPLALSGLFALTMAVQLLPLPPEWWRHLPFRAPYADALAAAGLVDGWRPSSIAPDLTINSLLALLPPLAALLGASTLDDAAHRRLLACILIATTASAALGLAQFVGGDASPLYLWADRSEAVADGVFANRNHQALFLACGLVLLGTWVAMPPRRGKVAPATRLTIGATATLLLLVGVVATGSRTGILLALLAAAYSYWVVRRSATFRDVESYLSRGSRSAMRWSWVALPLLLLAMILAGRAASFQRLTGIDAGEDQRFSSLPVMLQMTRAVFPWGSGFGTFDPLFRAFEPDGLLRYTVFNHAHDDFLETVIVGGLPAGLVVLLAIAWWGRNAWFAFRSGGRSRADERRRAAAVAILAIAIASAVDYPVRTPLIGCLLAILSFWLCERPGTTETMNCVAAAGAATEPVDWDRAAKP